MKNIFFVIASCFFVSCLAKNKVPSEIVQPDDMKKILWDVIKAQSLSTEIARKDSNVNEIAENKILTKRVFEIHKISEATFNQSYAWYTNHPDIMKIVFDSLNAQNQRESQLEMKEKHSPLKLDPLKRMNAIKKRDSLKKFNSENE